MRYRGLFASSPRGFASDVSINPFPANAAGVTNMLGGGRVLLNGIVYQQDDKLLFSQCYRGTDVSKVVGIELVSAGFQGQVLKPSPPSPHTKPTFKNLIIERFAERTKVPPIDDIYRRDGIYFPDLPKEVSLVTTYLPSRIS